MAFFNEFPNTRTYDKDLGWLIHVVGQLQIEVKTFIENNTINIPDQITWDITKQYTRNTLVIDYDGTAYLSKQPVPVGIAITNTDYWMPIFNYDDSINTLRANIATNERNHTTATAERHAGDLVWLGNTLYKVTADMPAGTAYIIGTNVDLYTVEDYLLFLKGAITAEAQTRQDSDTTLQGNIDAEAHARELADTALQGNIDAEALARQGADDALAAADTVLAQKLAYSTYVNVKSFGAVGDGVHDDTQAFKDAFDSIKNLGTGPDGYGWNASPRGGVVYVPAGKYMISSPLTLYSYIHVLGAGQVSTYIIPTADFDGDALFKTDGFDRLYQNGGLWPETSGVPLEYGMSNLTLHGNRWNHPAELHGILQYGYKFLFENIEVFGFSGKGLGSAAMTGSDYYYRNENRFFEGVFNNFYVRQCGNVGFELLGPTDCVVNNLFVSECDRIGVIIGTSAYVNYMHIYSDCMNDASLYDVVFSAGTYANTVVVESSRGNGLYINSYDVWIQHLQLYNNNGTQLSIETNLKNVRIDDLEIKMAPQTYYTNSLVGVTIAANTEVSFGYINVKNDGPNLEFGLRSFSSLISIDLAKISGLTTGIGISINEGGSMEGSFLNAIITNCGTCFRPGAGFGGGMSADIKIIKTASQTGLAWDCAFTESDNIRIVQKSGSTWNVLIPAPAPEPEPTPENPTP